MKTINQNNITKTNRTPSELLHFLLWTTTVAGKRSDVQTKKFNEFFNGLTLKAIGAHGNAIRARMKKVGLGQYNRLCTCWKWIHKNIQPTKLRTITRDELVKCPGIGPKTASFFIAHSQPWPEVAVLDTHVLRWLSQEFPQFPVPKTTPQDATTYRNLESLFLGRSCQLNLTPAELDNLIWQKATTTKTNN